MLSFIKKGLLLTTLMAPTAIAALPPAGNENLLLNPDFAFHSFINHCEGKAISWQAHTVAFWQHENYGDITVTRESHVADNERPDYSVQNIVSIAPGKQFKQFIPLAEAGLAHNQAVSLWGGGWQSAPDTLQAKLKLMKIDSEDGTWKPADFGASDKREFPRHARGELIVAKTASASIDKIGMLARFPRLQVRPPGIFYISYFFSRTFLLAGCASRRLTSSISSYLSASIISAPKSASNMKRSSFLEAVFSLLMHILPSLLGERQL